MKKIIFAVFCLIVTTKNSAQSTASDNIQTFKINAPQLDTIKQIWLYLPAGYKDSEKSYPVIYMHDAQNLFDASTSYAGEWKVDETLDSLKDPTAIIVGIEHGGDKRIDELTPFPNEKYGGGKGAAYVDFIRSTLKPFIDSNYRTLKGPENTIIFGSSLGGLISFYAAIKYPETFGAAGVFSPSFWFSPENYEFVKRLPLDPSQKFYFMAGTKESDTEVAEVNQMISLLKEKGLKDENFNVVFIKDGEHNEKLWSQAFPKAYLWLMQNLKQ